MTKQKVLFPFQCDVFKKNKAIEYCKNNNITLANELRKVVEKYYRLQLKNEELGV